MNFQCLSIIKLRWGISLMLFILFIIFPLISLWTDKSKEIPKTPGCILIIELNFILKLICYITWCYNLLAWSVTWVHCPLKRPALPTFSCLPLPPHSLFSPSRSLSIVVCSRQISWFKKNIAFFSHEETCLGKEVNKYMFPQTP